VIVDVHTHLLPGLDDGAPDLEASLRIARAAVAEGVGTMVGTPHVRPDFPTSPEARDAARRLLQDALLDERIPLRLLGGAEIALDSLGGLDESALESFSLGPGRCLLVESPYGSWPLGTPFTLGQLTRRGYRILLAHPERNRDVQDDVEFLRDYSSWGVMFQITAASVAGLAGRTAQATTFRLIEAGLAHVIASDAHGHAARPLSFDAARRQIDDDALFAWLSHDVPDAIVSAQEIPPRPPQRRRRGLLRGRR
jgi:protein-tyrosine phosphatase